MPGTGPDAVRGDLLDGRPLEVDQRHVRPVERRVVVRVERQPLGPDRELPGLEHLGGFRVADDLIDLGPDEVGRRLISRLADNDVVERPGQEGEPARLPLGREDRLPLLR
jgi:hypothetical protein